jgi:cytochrome c oxidase cbb3-type subunit IV
MLDLGIFRGILTAILLVLFLALVFWAFSPKRKNAFERAARAALEDDSAEQIPVRMKDTKL